jgi:hypothetical protein
MRGGKRCVDSELLEIKQAPREIDTADPFLQIQIPVLRGIS